MKDFPDIKMKDPYALLATNETTGVNDVMDVNAKLGALAQSVAEVAAEVVKIADDLLQQASTQVAGCTSTSALSEQQGLLNAAQTQVSNMTSAANTDTSQLTAAEQTVQSSIATAISLIRPAIDYLNALAQMVAAWSN